MTIVPIVMNLMGQVWNLISEIDRWKNKHQSFIYKVLKVDEYIVIPGRYNIAPYLYPQGERVKMHKKGPKKNTPQFLHNLL